METLFQKSLYTECERLKAQAINEVESLDRAIFGNPALAGVVQKITERHRIDIAEFRGEVNGEPSNARLMTTVTASLCPSSFMT
jgi:hypothetical protein